MSDVIDISKHPGYSYKPRGRVYVRGRGKRAAAWYTNGSGYHTNLSVKYGVKHECIEDARTWAKEFASKYDLEFVDSRRGK